MTTPTLRDTSQALINILKELHYGRMPERVQTAFDAVQEALAAQPELPEPVADVDEYGKVKWRGAVHTETALYTAAQLQQAVEQAQPKREPMPEEKLFELIHKHLGYRPHPHRHEHVIDSLKGRFHDKQRYRDLLSDIEAHHGIGDKA